MFDVPHRSVHRMRNPGEVQTRLRWEVHPALRTREFLTAAFAAADDGALLDPARVGALLREYADVFRVPAAVAVSTPARPGCASDHCGSPSSFD